MSIGVGAKKYADMCKKVVDPCVHLCILATSTTETTTIMTTRYRTELPCGTIVTRTSKTGRVYSHIVIRKREDEDTWNVIGYCGRYDLALKTQQQWSKPGREIMIVEAIRMEAV